MKKIRRIKCLYCGSIVLCREGKTNKEWLKMHFSNKYDTVIDGLNLFQPTRELNPCFGKGEK